MCTGPVITIIHWTIRRITSAFLLNSQPVPKTDSPRPISNSYRHVTEDFLTLLLVMFSMILAFDRICDITFSYMFYYSSDVVHLSIISFMHSPELRSAMPFRYATHKLHPELTSEKYVLTLAHCIMVDYDKTCSSQSLKQL